MLDAYCFYLIHIFNLPADLTITHSLNRKYKLRVLFFVSSCCFPVELGKAALSTEASA